MARLSAEIVVKSDITNTETIYPISNLLNIEFSGQDRSNPALPSWGIHSNSGSLEMYDADGNLASLKKDGSLLNSTINIYLVIDTRKEQIGRFIIKKVSEPKQDFIIKIEFSDTLTHWQKIQMPKIYFPSDSIEGVGRPLYDLYKEVVKKARIEVSLDAGVSYLMSVMHWPVLSLEAGSFWSQMTKICEALGCYIYCDNRCVPTMSEASELI